MSATEYSFKSTKIQWILIIESARKINRATPVELLSLAVRTLRQRPLRRRRRRRRRRQRSRRRLRVKHSNGSPAFDDSHFITVKQIKLKWYDKYSTTVDATIVVVFVVAVTSKFPRLEIYRSLPSLSFPPPEQENQINSRRFSLSILFFYCPVFMSFT